MSTLAGIVCVRNVIDLDYCFEQAIRSFLPICDEVVVCDSDSTDGTRERMEAWKIDEPKLNICNFPWPQPKGDPDFYPLWLNYARQHAKSKMCIYLDADEVLHEGDYAGIRAAADRGATLFFKRLNFWKNASNLIPEGHCCGTKVLRLASAVSPICSDYPYAPANETLREAVESSYRVFHYGFLRNRAAFFRKARVVQEVWVNSFDPRLEQAEGETGTPWMENECVAPWINSLEKYDGSHPAVIHQWLKERGNEV